VATPAGAVEDLDAVTYYVPELNNSVHPDPRNDPHLVKCYQEFVAAWKEVKSVNCGGKNRKHKSPHSQVSKIVFVGSAIFDGSDICFSSISMYAPFLFIANQVANSQGRVVLLCTGRFLRTRGTKSVLSAWLMR
jgi:hypothetical protein